MSEHIAFVVNGTSRELNVEPRRLLVQALREDLELLPWMPKTDSDIDNISPRRGFAAKSGDGTTVLRGDLLSDLPVACDAVLAGGELTLHVLPERAAVVPDPCIRCGWCVHTCPTSVQPAGLLEAAQLGDRDLAEHYGLGACIECGICNYVCPSRLPLLEGIRTLRRRGTGR